MKPLISILVPVYNMQTYLRRCIESLQQQTWLRIEIILINDGSTDESGTICDCYAENDKRICVVHQINAGLSAARNIGITKAKGEYLTHVDADDWVLPTYVESLYELCLQYNTSLSACNHNIIVASVPYPRFSSSKNACVFTLHQAYQNILYDRPPDVSAWGKLYHKSLFEGLEYPVGKLYEDTSLFALVLAKSEKIAYTYAPLYNYFMRDNSITRSGYNTSKLDYLEAVDRLTKTIALHFPDLEKGCIRRKTHALLSVRRYFFRCSSDLIPLKNSLEMRIKNNAATALFDLQVPWRDKFAIIAVLLHCYDTFWAVYSKHRY